MPSFPSSTRPLPSPLPPSPFTTAPRLQRSGTSGAPSHIPAQAHQMRGGSVAELGRDLMGSNAVRSGLLSSLPLPCFKCRAFKEAPRVAPRSGGSRSLMKWPKKLSYIVRSGDAELVRCRALDLNFRLTTSLYHLCDSVCPNSGAI